jgi:hypothetical protein
LLQLLSHPYKNETSVVQNKRTFHLFDDKRHALFSGWTKINAGPIHEKNENSLLSCQIYRTVPIFLHNLLKSR